MNRFIIAAAAALAVGHLAGAGDAAEPMPFRISLETSPNHIKTKSLEKFVADLSARTKGELDVKLFHSAQLFKERDVAKGLRQGSVEMAMPAFVHIDGIVPDAGVVLLPAFYGLDRAASHKIADGAVGKELNRRLEEKLAVKVVGRYLDLGFVHTYTTAKKIATYDDFKGLKLRVQGGAANLERYRFFGANPTVIPWPDMPMALSQKTVDGLASSHESIRSAKLWDSGIRFAFEDHQWFAQYVPTVSRLAWDKLSPKLRTAIEQVWEANIDAARAMSAAREQEARQAMIANGITVVTPSAAELTKRRNQLLARQDEVVKSLKIDPQLAAMVTREVQGLR